MKQKLLKTAAFLLALVLLGGLCFLANGLVGNPISKHLTEKNVKEYLAEQYAQQGYEITHIYYSFEGNYAVCAEVPDSIDSTFYIYTGLDGKIKGDTYETDVLNRQNTADRINSAYSAAVDEVLNNPNFPYQTNQNLVLGKIEFDVQSDNSERSYVISQAELELDMLYDLDKFGAKAGHIILHVQDDTFTAERLAQIMLDTKSVLEQGGVTFYSMDCVLEHPYPTDGSEYNYEDFAVREFPYSDIYEEGMVERVRFANESISEYY